MAMRRFALLSCLVFMAVLFLRTLPARPQAPGGQNVRVSAKRTILGDINKLFDMLAKGGQTLTIGDTGAMRASLTEYARQQVILVESITLEQFGDFGQLLPFQALVASGMNPVLRKPAGPVDDGMDQQAALAFQRRDLDGNGVLDWDEMEASLRDNLAYWDVNRDNFIDLAEYKFFYRSKMEGRQARRQARAEDAVRMHFHGYDVPDLSELDKRPVVYRFGHMPDGLPDWFTELDIDEDGQIGLYEWQQTGKSNEEFEAIDRNGDGLITAEELLYFMAK